MSKRLRYRFGFLYGFCVFPVVYWALVFCPLPHASAQGYVLSDTGQNKCYDGSKEIPCPKEGEPYYGQDAQYSGPQPAFHDNGNGTVNDLNTSLMWQQGDDHNDREYTWEEASAYCTGLDLGGYADWRLPSRRELVSIVSYGRYYPSINTQYFPDCRSSSYWSGSTDASTPDDAWRVSFYNGYVGYYNKTSSLYVRCVREGP